MERGRQTAAPAADSGIGSGSPCRRWQFRRRRERTPPALCRWPARNPRPCERRRSHADRESLRDACGPRGPSARFPRSARHDPYRGWRRCTQPRDRPDPQGNNARYYDGSCPLFPCDFGVGLRRPIIPGPLTPRCRTTNDRRSDEPAASCAQPSKAQAKRGSGRATINVARYSTLPSLAHAVRLGWQTRRSNDRESGSALEGRRRRDELAPPDAARRVFRIRVPDCAAGTCAESRPPSRVETAGSPRRAQVPPEAA